MFENINPGCVVGMNPAHVPLYDGGHAKKLESLGFFYVPGTVDYFAYWRYKIAPNELTVRMTNNNVQLWECGRPWIPSESDGDFIFHGSFQSVCQIVEIWISQRDVWNARWNEQKEIILKGSPSIFFS